MATSTFKIEELRHHFAGKDEFSVRQISDFYRWQNIYLHDQTLRWRIYRLVKMGVLQRVGHGLYKLGSTITFIPEITKYTGELYNSLRAHFPFTKISIWHTSSLNEFMLHQPGRFMHLVEVEKDAAESVFYFLKEHFKDVYLNPNSEIIQKYIAGKQECIIIKNLITEAPLQEMYEVLTPTLEKILVDIFSNDVIFSHYQGFEMSFIFENAFRKYSINLTTLLRYAQRRGKRYEIEAYLLNLALIKKLKPSE